MHYKTVKPSASVHYLCDLDVGVLRELGHEEVLTVLLGLHLGVELQPGDGRLWTQVPVQRLQRRTTFTMSAIASKI